MFVTAEVFKIPLDYLAYTKVRVRPFNSTYPFLRLTCLGQGQVILCHLNPCLSSGLSFEKCSSLTCLGQGQVIVIYSCVKVLKSVHDC